LLSYVNSKWFYYFTVWTHLTEKELHMLLAQVSGSWELQDTVLKFSTQPYMGLHILLTKESSSREIKDTIFEFAKQPHMSNSILLESMHLNSYSG